MLLIDHLRYRRHLDAHVDEELTGNLANRVAIHVAICPMCRREAELTVRIKRSLARIGSLTGRVGDRVRHWTRPNPN